MGDHFQTLVDPAATPEGAPRPARHRAVAPAGADDEPCDGLAVHTARTVFTGGQGDAGRARCPRCAGAVRLHTDAGDHIDETWEPFGRAIGLWATTGTAGVRCPACAATVPVADWTWDDDCFALGHLGLAFWNRPALTDDFRARPAGRLGGHRTVHIQGKL
ncbi:hypothetical protein [Streptomyces sp. NPDC048720]|uniref:hypothetical protein n=1 Tax=Streptomyces sp. NPDC048720 TaxID=3365588 RepID=UPI003712E02D